MTDIERQKAAIQGLNFSIVKPAALAIFLGVSGASATLPTAVMAQSYNFSSVQIEGLQGIGAATVLTYLGIGKGQQISAAELNDAYQRLVGSGLFESVDLSPRGGTLVVKISEYPMINRINIEGNSGLKDDVLLPQLSSSPRRVFNPAAAERDAQTIAEAYQANGRLAAEVTPRIIRRPQNRVDLVFEVVEGKNTEIERITFNGNRSYSDGRLRRVITSKQAGILRFLMASDTFDPGRAEFDKQLLKDFYMSRGFVDVDVVSVTSQVTENQDAYFVTYQLTEGQQFSFGKIQASSTLDGVEAADFEVLAEIRPGTTYSPAVVDRAVARMEQLAQKRGLGFVRVRPSLTRNERDGTLDIDFIVERGARVVVERIDIEGNSTTLDRVVRSQFTTVEGDPFNPREIRAAAERIRALGYFANVDVQAKPGTDPDAVVVDVNLEEQGTGSFYFGGSYAFGEGFGVSASFTETNFLGRGQYLNIEIAGGIDEQKYMFAFAEPNLFGRDLRFSVNGAYTTSTEIETAAYDTEIITGSLGLEFPVSELGRLGFKVGVNGANMFNYSTLVAGTKDALEFVGDSAILIAEEARGFQIGAAANATYTYDTRRNGLQEPLNFYFRGEAGFGGLGSDSTYFKATALANITTTVMNDDDITLSGTFEGGAIQTISGPGTRAVDRFNLGSDQLLGFSSMGTGPRDTAATLDTPLGGNYYGVARLEAKFPIGFPDEYGIKGGVFAHAGSVWGLDSPGTVDDAFHLRASAGVALHWDTPVGPLRFSYAVPFMSEATDTTSRFGVSMSTGF